MGICVGIGAVFGYHMDYVAPLCVRVHSVFLCMWFCLGFWRG